MAEKVTNIEGDYVSKDDAAAFETRIADLEGGVSQATFDALLQRVTALENADAAPQDGDGTRRLHASPDHLPHSYLPSSTQLNAVIYFNSAVFDAHNYGDPVKKTSKITT